MGSQAEQTEIDFKATEDHQMEPKSMEVDSEQATMDVKPEHEPIQTEQESTKIEPKVETKRAHYRKNAISFTTNDLSQMEPVAKQAKIDLETTEDQTEYKSMETEQQSTEVNTDQDSKKAQLRKKSSTDADLGLACPKCCEPFVDTRTPQILPGCHHVICNHCLKKMTRYGADSTIKCPQCRRTSSIPNGGTSAMETNKWLQELSQLYHMGKLRNRMDEIAEDLKLMKIEAEGTVTDLKTLEKDTCDTLKMEEDLVDRCVQAAQAEAWVMKAKIREIGENRLKCIGEDLKYLENRASNITTAYEMMSNTSEDADEIHYDDLADKLEHILSTPTPPEQKTKSPQVAKFLREKVSLGRVIRLRNLELVSGFKDNFVRVQDLAVTPNGLLVVCDSGPNGVTVYREDSNNNNSYPIFKRKLRLSLNKANPNKPTGVAATPDGKYILARQTGIEVYSMAGAYEKTYHTMDKTKKPDIHPCVFSVTVLGGNKILAGDITRNLITVHNLEGIILKTLSTPIKPWCIVPAMDDHLMAITDWRRSKLCVQHISSGSVTLNLDVPEALGVCYDKGSDSFLVGRGEKTTSKNNTKPLMGTSSGVVEQHNSTGDRTIIVCLAQDMQGPGAMVFTADDMLAVADFNGVKIYRVT